MFWDIMQEIAAILIRTEGHAIAIQIHADRNSLNYRITDSPHRDWRWSLTINKPDAPHETDDEEAPCSN